MLHHLAAGGVLPPAVALLGAVWAVTARADALPDFDRLWNHDDPAATEAKFRALLPQAESSGDASYLCQLLTQIARTQGLQRKFDEAHRTLDRVEGTLREDLKVARVRCVLERGRVFNSSKQAEKAKPLFLQAWEAARAAREDNLACDAAHMLGIVEPGDAGIAWNRKAMELAEGSQDLRAKGWLGALYNNLGWTYHDQGDYAKALELFEKGLAWRQERNEPAQTRIAKWTVARALRSLGRVVEALARQRELLAEFEAAKGKDGYVLEELGECLLALGRTEEARPWFAQAYELLSKDAWLAASEAKRLERMRELGAAK